jgi:hypothetical protein
LKIEYQKCVFQLFYKKNYIHNYDYYVNIYNNYPIKKWLRVNPNQLVKINDRIWQLTELTDWSDKLPKHRFKYNEYESNSVSRRIPPKKHCLSARSSPKNLKEERKNQKLIFDWQRHKMDGQTKNSDFLAIRNRKLSG